MCVMWRERKRLTRYRYRGPRTAPYAILGVAERQEDAGRGGRSVANNSKRSSQKKGNRAVSFTRCVYGVGCHALSPSQATKIVKRAQITQN